MPKKTPQELNCLSHWIPRVDQTDSLNVFDRTVIVQYLDPLSLVCYRTTKTIHKDKFLHKDHFYNLYKKINIEQFKSMEQA